MNNIEPFFSKKIDNAFSWTAIVGAVLFVALFGVAGVFRSGQFGFDFLVFHKAGVDFVNSVDPWLASIGTGAPFSYPPHISGFILFYGVLPLSVALGIHTVLNLFSVAVVAWLANKWFIRHQYQQPMALATGLAIAISLGNPFIAHSVYEGQWSLPAVSFLFLSWHFLKSQKTLLAGIFLGLATIKPQVSILYIVWLLIHRDIRVLLYGFGVAVVLMSPALFKFGLVGVFESWFQSMEYYGTQYANIPGTFFVVGLNSFFVSQGVMGLDLIFKLGSIAAVVALYVFRNSVSDVLTVILFLVFALTFIYGHDTDYVTLSILWSYFICLAFQRRDWLSLGGMAVVLLLMFFPQRFLREIPVDVLHHTRTFALILGAVMAYRWERAMAPAETPS